MLEQGAGCNRESNFASEQKRVDAVVGVKLLVTKHVGLVLQLVV